MIVAGVGFSNTATSHDIVDIIHRAQAASGHCPQWIAVPSSKAGHAGFLAAAAALSLKWVTIESSRLHAVQIRCPTRSLRAFAATGLVSVAEACALGALEDEEALLILPRVANRLATCALASGTSR